jgi:nitrite reductase/ring-hydroxylating ferredoxin subunit
MTKFAIAAEDEIGEGERLVTQVEGREIAVFNVDGEYYAYTNWCAHQSGPVCEGAITGTVTANFDGETLETELEWNREDEVLNCPWHGWEFDVTSGECLSRSGARLLSHPVRVEDGEVVVEL